MSHSAALEEYRQRLAWLWGLIRAPSGPADVGPESELPPPGAGLRRLRGFLGFAGDPHRAFPSVHIAGTSGKTSVTTLMARMLHAAGYKTGYHVSPYLQLPHEKLILAERWISVAEFNALLSEFAALYAGWQRRTGGAAHLRYGEAWVALTFLFLARGEVDWGVVECGLGGRWDPTNALQPRVSLITSVGRDHLVSLGGSLKSIAEHKAGVIKPGAPAVTGVSDPSLLAILQKEARISGTALHTVGPARAGNGPVFRFRILPAEGRPAIELQSPFAPPRELLLPGRSALHAANVAQAVSALEILRASGQVDYRTADLQRGLDMGPVPGRMEILQRDPLVILDCAHNPPKMHALVSSLKEIYPERKFHIVAGMLRSKEAAAVMRPLCQLPGDFRLTQPHVYRKAAHAPGDLKEALPVRQRSRVQGLFTDVGHALDDALAAARPDWIILVTGSVYMAGEARDRWHPRERLLQDLARFAPAVREAGAEARPPTA